MNFHDRIRKKPHGLSSEHEDIINLRKLGTLLNLFVGGEYDGTSTHFLISKQLMKAEIGENKEQTRIARTLSRLRRAFIDTSAEQVVGADVIDEGENFRITLHGKYEKFPSDKLPQEPQLSR